MFLFVLRTLNIHQGRYLIATKGAEFYNQIWGDMGTWERNQANSVRSLPFLILLTALGPSFLLVLFKFFLELQSNCIWLILSFAQ